jgi:hypothetical protein
MAKAISCTLKAGIHNVNKLSGVLGIGFTPISQFTGLLVQVDKVEKFKGKAMAIKLWKYWYNCICRKAMKEPNTEQPPYWMRLRKDGFPSILTPFLKKVEKGNNQSIRLIISSFRVFELARVAPVIDLNTIIGDSQGPRNFETKHKQRFKDFLNNSRFTEMVKKDLNRTLLKCRTDDKDIKFHYTVKSGISGSCLGTALSQTVLFDEEKQLKAKLVGLSKFFYEEDLETLIHLNRSSFDLVTNDITKPRDLDKLKKCPGRITFISSKGGKTRCVAIGNYWIQNTLKPLHTVMFKGLRHIAMDGTYDQHRQSSRVAEATKEGPVWSYDLTNATDRIPINIQCEMMIYFFGEIGILWGEILNEIRFCFKDKCIKYKVGQPMGLYSSWASLALVHHVIIQYAANNVGIAPFLNYSVLGDDVAIWDKAVAEEYTRIIQDLDVEISKAKSYIPRSGDTFWKAEFAKRLYLKGEEISGISPDVLAEGFKSFWNFPELVNFLVRHGFARITEVPISRVAKIFRLSSKDVDQLVCAFRVNEILGGQSIQIDLSLDTIIAERLSSLTITKLMLERIDELTESIGNISSDLFDEEETNRAVLEKHLGSEIISDENLVYNRILKDRIKEILALEKRMLKYIPSEGDDIEQFLNSVKVSDEIEYEDNILTKIKDIEYIPTVKLEELIKGITLHKDKKQYRILYLKRLVRKYLGLTQTRKEAEIDDFDF